MRKTITCLFLLLLFSAVSFAVPGQISFQGVLKDSAGNPITGTRSVVFNIYPTATGAGSLWTETQTVSVEAGLYNVQLGGVSPITASVFDGSTRYLAVSIGGSELLPRVVLLTVPYAYRAEKADTATYADTSGSSGGIPNAVLFNPPTIQTTTEGTPIWLSTGASGSGGGLKAGISAEATGTYTCGVLGILKNQYALQSAGVVGASIATDSNSAGVTGYTWGSGSNGVKGQAGGTNSIGVHGRAVGTGGVGVYGIGALGGGSFEAEVVDGAAVYGRASYSNPGSNYGGYFTANARNGYGVYSLANGTAGTGVRGMAPSTTGMNYGGEFYAYGDQEYTAGVRGYAVNESASGKTYGGYFVSSGVTDGTVGVFGMADYSGALTTYGGYFDTQGQSGVGVYAHTWAPPGYAAVFSGGYGIVLPSSSSMGPPAVGTIRYNDSTGSFEGYTSGGWVTFH